MPENVHLDNEIVFTPTPSEVTISDVFTHTNEKYVHRKDQASSADGHGRNRSRLSGMPRNFREDPVFNLYFGKFLQAWGDRMWIFSIPLLILDLHVDPMPKLLLPALYGFCSGASTILFGPLMGEWVDRVPRLKAAKVVSLFQNGIVAFGGLVLAIAIQYRALFSASVLYFFIAVILLCGFTSNIFFAGSIIVLEKDWAVVVAQNDNHKLAHVTSTIRRIELLTSVVCPLVMAQFMTYAGHSCTALIIGIWSAGSMATEYFQLKRTCRVAGDWMEKRRPPRKTSEDRSLAHKLCSPCVIISSGWKIFARHEVCNAAMSMAFLEATVLVFSGITNGYAVSQGFSKTTIALLAGGDALTGIFGTFVFPLARRRVKLETICLLAMLMHFVCGSVCVGSNWMPGSPFDPEFLLNPHTGVNVQSNTNSTDSPSVDQSRPNHDCSISFLVFAVALTVGRCAYWMIDLSGSQLILERVKEEERGTICAVHYSLKKLLNRFRYILALVFSSPETFGFLIIFSQGFSIIGYVLFASYVKLRSHKFGRKVITIASH